MDGIYDFDVGHAHYECFRKKRGYYNAKVEDESCCKQMLEVIGHKIIADPFKKCLAVYKEDNDYKYYFSDVKYCPFCGWDYTKIFK